MRAMGQSRRGGRRCAGWVWALAVVWVAASPGGAAGADLPQDMGEETRACVECHRMYTPGIVYDWLRSRHAWTPPEKALARPEQEHRFSRGDVPAGFGGKVVGCFECHGQAPDAHPDAFDHMGFRIHVVVTPRDCSTCHPLEAEQYGRGKKAFAHENLARNPVYALLVDTVAGSREWEGGHLVRVPSDATNRWETCYGCHGTRVTVEGSVKVRTALGELEVPNLRGWPNQGVGRINPDGSRGACTSCHARHAFSIRDARDPHTCSQCHLEPDVPAWNVFRDSKHGNLYEVRAHEFEWEAVPWVVGRDFTAPTCAVCHVSLLADDQGQVIAERSHDFGARLWVRIFGLPYAHPQPGSGATYELRNPDGQPLPVTFEGEPAEQGLIGPRERERRRELMARVCNACHNRQWIGAHFAKLDRTIRNTNAMVRTATRLVQEAWRRGLADPANPFDEPLEHLWLRSWLFYTNSIRYASAMTGAPDYATFKNGWWDLNETLERLGAALAEDEEHDDRGR